ncbi:MAG: hypothetical protein ABIF19_02335 [Planctomycetota bacterium]
MKRKCRLRGVAFFLAICASVISACICVLLMAGEYHSARFELGTYNHELQGWEACRQTQLTYFEANNEAVSLCVRNLEEARANFWVKLPRAQLIGLFIAGGLGSATGAYLATYGIVWFAGMVISRFAMAMAVCFRGTPKVQIHR